MSKKPLNFVCSCFHKPKRGNAECDYEDAFAVDLENRRFAIADGATESLYSDHWARLLVAEHVRNPVGTGEWSTWLPPLQEKWLAEVAGPDAELPWYAQEKIKQGAHATLLAIVVEQVAGRWKWKAVAVGDSCLIVVRGDRIVHAFPVSRAEEFGTTPELIGSRSPPGEIPDRESRADGELRAGDRLYLMTDALAHWFLSQAGADEEPWSVLFEEASTAENPWTVLDGVTATSDAVASFSKWIDELRAGARIRNDDVTLVRVAFC